MRTRQLKRKANYNYAQGPRKMVRRGSYAPPARSGYQETKNFDTYESIELVGQNASIRGINSMRPGTADQQRVGRKIHQKSLSIRADFFWPHEVSGEQAGQQILRFMVVSAPSALQSFNINDVLSSAAYKPTQGVTHIAPDAPDAVIGSGIERFRNLDKTKRFKVLMDKTIVFQRTYTNEIVSNETNGGSVEKFMKKSINLNLPAEFTDVYEGNPPSVSVTVTPESGGLWYILQQQNTTSAVPTSQTLKCDITTRLRYTDN